MWWLLSLAHASEAVAPLLPLEQLPWQVQDEARWIEIHAKSTRLARAGGWVSVASAGAMGVGITMLVLADAAGTDTLAPPGGLLTGLGVAGALVGPPLMLSSSMRANRALRERGVFVSTTPAITGWTLYGLSIFATPFFVVAWPLAPAYYGAIIGCGFGQLEVNRVGRTNARLQVRLVPTRHGLGLAGSF
jgi:hypothetical protein